jgi:hypothetical protein
MPNFRLCAHPIGDENNVASPVQKQYDFFCFDETPFFFLDGFYEQKKDHPKRIKSR